MTLVDTIDKEDVRQFCGLMRERLLDRNTSFSKEYVQLLVDKIVLKGKQVVVHGNYRSLVGAVKFAGEKTNPLTTKGVSGFLWNLMNSPFRYFLQSNTHHG